MSSDSAQADPAPVWYRRLIFNSISSALCASLPVPLLDEHLLKLLRRRMTREIADEAETWLSEDDVEVLSGTAPKSGWGCFVGVLLAISFKIAAKLIRRIFRTIFFWLLVKDASEAASKTFHEGYLLRRGLEQQDGYVDAWALRSRVERVCTQVDTRPFQRLFKESLRGVGWLFSHGGRLLLRLRPGRSNSEKRQLVDDQVDEGFVDRLTRQLTADSSYLRALDRAWDELPFDSDEAPPRPSPAPEHAGP